MNGAGGDAPPFPSSNGGEFLLSLLQKPKQRPETTAQQFPSRPSPVPQPPQPQQPVPNDPAVAAVGPAIPFAPPNQWPSNGRDLSPSWPHNLSPPFVPHNYLGFPQNPTWSSPPPQGINQQLLCDDLLRLGFSDSNYAIHNLVVQQQKQQQEQQQQQQQQKLLFGSFQSQIQPESLLTLNGYNFPNGLDRNRQFDPRTSSISNSPPNSFQHRNLENSRELDARIGKQQQHYRSTPPPGFPNSSKAIVGGGNNSRKGFDYNVDKEKANYGEFNQRVIGSEGGKMLGASDVGITRQLDRPRPPSGSNLGSVSALDIEESMLDLHRDDGQKHWDLDRTRMENGPGNGRGGDELDDFGEELVDSLLPEDELDHKNDKKQHRNSREKESRSDNRGKRLLSQRIRNLKWQMECRSDIYRLNTQFLSIYESLIPPEEEKAKQKQLLTLLEKLVCKEWPEARLYLYGSCANSFGVSKSDIDVCLAIGDADINKSEVLLKLADILQSDNLQNVQALTRARVPIVKLMDPVTGISCDICINNLLAVVNTKLLRDYAGIDVRLRQLAFIVKHWAKSRGVNETYQGTLSSYAYVLMCIHFLQQRKPAILPCLQGMRATYSVTVDDKKCAFFDQVENLRDFGSRNRETIAQLVWGFFNYWAYGHDYTSSVISVRTGSVISKLEKDWTRRVGNDRHLICIEDPFETSHDLGRVVDKFSIKVLREEFERAADIMHYAPNPCVKLFEPYVPS
ncbi:hypothetical protein EZV62_009738 [Acer yangbiense]|uniref:RNA uridylyltransferase n=1 Tax=Acer yangbiense TaxID=1000413 RepID=A0A5C7I107_9ROSI|nr:hypothetical protein EZV62_009738 [Acer yangbiense]